MLNSRSLKMFQSRLNRMAAQCVIGRGQLRFILALSISLSAWHGPRAAAAQEDQPAARPQLPPGAVVVGKDQMLVARPLPTFLLYTADDQAVPAQALVQPGYWLVVYRDAACTQCDALMQILSKHSQDAPRMVFVVSGMTGSDFLQLSEKYPDLAEAHWLRDVQSSFASSLNIAGTPHILGMRDGVIRWQRGGVSSADATLPAAIDGWFKYNLLPPNKFVRTPATKPTDQKRKSAENTANPAADVGSTKGQN